MQLYEQGKRYWQIAKMFHENRTAPMMKPTSLRDMTRALQDSTSPAVSRRMASFIARHETRSPPPGPRYA